MVALRRSEAEAAVDKAAGARVRALNPSRPIDPTRQAQRGEGAVRELVIGRGIVLSGDVSCDKLIIEGNIKGSLTGCRDIEISESGLFKGSAATEQAEISGRFEGSLVVHRRLLIKAGGQVTGMIRYGAIEIEPGGRISGDIWAQPISEGAVSEQGADVAEAMGRALQSAFGRATKAAVSQAHKAGLAVPGRRGSSAVEITPDGRERTLDADRIWSPTDWKAVANG